MNLTPSQKTTLKNFINNNAPYNTFPAGPEGSASIAALLNTADAGPFVVWRSSVPITEIMNNGFVWDRVDNATVGQARIWEWMKDQGAINPSKQNIRDGIDAAWPGTPNATQRTGIYTHCKRNATVLEKLFATGTGTDVSPATLVVEGNISYAEVQAARES